MLRKNSVIVFKKLTDKSNRIIKLIARCSNIKHNHVTATTGEIYFNNASQVEATIQSEVSKEHLC